MKTLLFCCFTLGAICCSETASAQSASQSASRFFFRDDSGRGHSVRVIHRYWKRRIIHPFAHVDPRINPKLLRAASIGEERANARSKGLCWRYVKTALLESGAVNSYPKSSYAAEAGPELMQSYGFTKLSMRDPYKAPVGAVIVYGNVPRGHVEIRTHDGFVSDYHSKWACYYPVQAVYAKL